MSMAELPRWDLTPIFPSLQSPEFSAEFEAALAGIPALAARFDELGVRRREDGAVTDELVARFEEILGAVNTLQARLRKLSAFIYCHVTTDAKDDLAKSLSSRIETQSVLLTQLFTRLTAWVGSSEVEALLAASPLARDHQFWVRRAALLEKHQMTEAEEDLAAALSPMSLGGWSRLHRNMSALLTAKVQVDGAEQTLPISAVRALATHADRETRRRAFEAELEAWKTIALPCAAAMNSIKGAQRTLRERRGFPDDVASSLVTNSIDAETLAAMHAACVASFPDFHRYIRAKARALGVPKLAWYDMLAPVGQGEETWTWEAATGFLEANFGQYSGKLAEFGRRSFAERWTDAPPRVGKVGGAYCIPVGEGDSRVLMNFDGSFNDVSTLAHELGHAYHNLCLKDRSATQKNIPMTLAETASIFCETLVFEAAVAKAERAGKLSLLDSALERNLQIVVDIHSRFLFEKGVYEKRGERELTEAEFSALMTQAQLDTYGPDLEPLHPYMWAVKGHYYGPSFYNYPYTFGLLFGLGLYAAFQKDPETFRAKYDDFLSRCAMADARSLAADFGFDIADRAFWEASLDIVRGQIAEFEALVPV
jgi:oligoendopeptidase F